MTIFFQTMKSMGKTINQFLKDKRESLLPQVLYPCGCKFRCERLMGTEGACDNCGYCGTDGIDQYREERDINHIKSL